MRKSFFYIHTNIVTKKWGKKSAKQFFQKLTNSASKKCWGKNFGINFEKCFLYSHEYRDEKMGGIKLTKKFFQKQTNSASKKCWLKNRRKKVRKTFFYFTRIS